MWLFWHLARSRNPHLHIVNCGFSNFGNLQNSLHYTIFMGGVALLKSLPNKTEELESSSVLFYFIINSSVVSFGT